MQSVLLSAVGSLALHTPIYLAPAPAAVGGTTIGEHHTGSLTGATQLQLCLGTLSQRCGNTPETIPRQAHPKSLSREGTNIRFCFSPFRRFLAGGPYANGGGKLRRSNLTIHSPDSLELKRKGYMLDAKGYTVDVKGYMVDVKGYIVDAKRSHQLRDVAACDGAADGGVLRQHA
eukprot:574029-Prorocentrum_minimum.AAC.2